MVAARIVRSEQRQVRLESATLARKDYNVALEFLDLTPATTAAIRYIITANQSARPTRDTAYDGYDATLTSVRRTV